MDVVRILRWLGRFGLCVVLLGAPLVVWRRCVVLLGPVRGRPGGLVDPSVIAGTLAGATLLAAALPEHAIGFGAIFGVGGYWDMPAAALPDLIRHMPDVAATLILDGLAADTRGNMRALLVLAAALWLAGVLTATVTRPGALIKRVAADATVLLISVYGTMWSLTLLLWLGNRLNVWIILLAILAIQDIRYRKPPIILRVWRTLMGPPPRW